MTVSEQDFERAADHELRSLDEALDAIDALEVDLSMGILTIELPDGTKYVVNSHRAARQIWMAADLSAWHFDRDPETGRWVAAKQARELREVLEEVLSLKLGAPVSLGRGAG